ncbi:MAG: hypothetical protein ABH818_00760 [Patescibacteria group bacterium]|nr:hypothetical protein [Patescibacteria group bacterium]MBU1870561.1 hypothetical protein [Patescibacteria group bacterium]
MINDKKTKVEVENLALKKKLNIEKLNKIEEKANEKEIIPKAISEQSIIEANINQQTEDIGLPLITNSLLNTASQLKQRQKQIEKILESGLEKAYNDLPNDKKEKFKIIGEQTAAKINLLLNKAKIKIKDIINLIKQWLLFIPGINKYFLEQEAKIKANKIIKNLK